MGDGGDGYGDGMPTATPTAAPSHISLSLPEPDAPRYRPGLLFLGEMKTEELIEKAKSIGLHLVVELTAKVSRNRQGIVQNHTRMRVLDVATGTQLSMCRFDNVQIYKEYSGPKRKSVTESVGTEIDQMLKIAGEKIKAQAIPNNLPKDWVMNRIAKLLGVPFNQRLEALAEIRLYQSRGLISEAEFHHALDLLLGVESLALVAGTTEQQRDVLTPFAERFRQ